MLIVDVPKFLDWGVEGIGAWHIGNRLNLRVPGPYP